MPTREAIVAADHRHVFRPFTPTDEHAREDSVVVSSASGPFLFDADGRRYFDATGAWWCNGLGYQHPRLIRALAEQAERLCHAPLAGATHEQAAMLAEELCAVAPPGLTRAFYGDDGSTAVEIATKLAFQYWQQNGRPERTRFLALPGGYHGDTVGSMSLGGVDAFHAVYKPLLFRVERAAEDDLDAGFDHILATLRSGGETVAGVVVEPLVQGAAGMRFYDRSRLQALREAADRADTFLVFDEVFTGFGRTGTFWAADQAVVAPDLLCTAKGLSGGMLPFAAVLATTRIHAGFAGSRARGFLHGHTFCGNPLGARVAREVLAVFRDEDILGQAKRTSETLAEGFAKLGTLPGVRDARTLGCVAALELGPPGYLGTRGWAVREAALARGVFLRPLGNTLYVIPPLNVARADLEQALDAIGEAISAAD